MIAAERSLSFGAPHDGDPNVIPLTDTAPALVASFALTPAIFSSKETVDDVLAAIRAEADKFIEVRDISTPAGRAAIASFAHSKIAKSKTALDELGKTVKDEAQQKVFTVDAERRRIRDFLDALRDEVRKPLTDWEEKDRKRVQDHENALVGLRALSQFSTFQPTSEMVRNRIAELEPYAKRHWEEFHDRAYAITLAVSQDLVTILGLAEKREAEQAARDRAERERLAREQQEREERIAREAREEAERRQREAEERQAAAEQAQREIAAKIERDRLAFIEGGLAAMRSFTTCDPARSSDQLLQRQADLDLLFESHDWQEFAEQARNIYTDSHSSLTTKIAHARQREEIETTRRERRIAEEARAAEMQRQAEATAAATAEQERRENNRRIRNRVRRQIAEAIVRVAENDIARASTTQSLAEMIAEAMIDGNVPHVTVTF